MVDPEDFENIVLNDAEIEFLTEGGEVDNQKRYSVRNSVEEVPKILASLIGEIALLYEEGYLDDDERGDGYMDTVNKEGEYVYYPEKEDGTNVWEELVRENWIDDGIRSDLLNTSDIHPSPVNYEDEPREYPEQRPDDYDASVGNKFGNALYSLYLAKKTGDRDERIPREIPELVYGFICAFIGRHPFEIEYENEEMELLLKKVSKLHEEKSKTYKKEKEWRMQNKRALYKEYERYNDVFEEFTIDLGRKVVRPILDEIDIELSEYLDEKFVEQAIYSGRFSRNIELGSGLIQQETDDTEQWFGEQQEPNSIINILDIKTSSTDESEASAKTGLIKNSVSAFLEINQAILLVPEFREVLEKDAGEVRERDNPKDAFKHLFRLEEGNKKINRTNIRDCDSVGSAGYATRIMNRFSGKTEDHWSDRPLVEEIDKGGDKEWEITDYGYILGWYMFEIDESTNYLHEMALEKPKVIWYILDEIERLRP